MRAIGISLLVLGAILIIFGLAADTTVGTGTGSRVHNIGLLTQQMTLVMLGGFSGVIGAVLLISARPSRASRVEEPAPVVWRPLSISRAWDETKARIAADGRLMTVVAAALIALPTLVTGVINPGRAGGDGSLWTLLIMFIGALLAVVGQLAIIRLAIGPSVSVGEAIGHGARRMPIYFIAGILIVIAMIIAGLPFLAMLLLAGVPLQNQAVLQSAIAVALGLLYLALLIFVAVRMLMASPVASEEAVGPIGILRRSWQLTEGHWWRLFGFILMFLIGAIIALGAIGAAAGVIAVMLFGPVEPMSASALVVAIVDAMVNAVITVFLAVMLARIYLQLSGVDSLDVTVPKTGT